jgi:flavin reductase (DIM6/NTAB) family NADH-FMN oxidoreductase RutF
MSAIRKKPWNRVDQPVYSISSAYNGVVNMNICSYVTPVSMNPKRYIVAIYKNTKTLELIEQNPQFLLQFLTEDQYKLVNLLGKKSGLHTNKIERIKEPVELYNDSFAYLSQSLAYLHLRVLDWLDGGDHWCTLCDVVAYKNLNPGKPLSLELLKKKKIIRS